MNAEKKYFAGIGSRNISSDMEIKMETISRHALENNWILRSGGANGSDSAFEKPYLVNFGEREIFLPWSGFNNNKSTYYKIPDRCFELAAKIHPAWNSISNGAKKLHARNCQQVLGYMLDEPVKFVVCYTKDGCEHHSTRTKDTGGTGSAIALASLNNIPVYNLNNFGRYEEVLEIIKHE